MGGGHGRRTDQDRFIIDIHHDPGLPGDCRAVADFQVTGDTGLAAHRDVMAERGGAGDSDLGHDQPVGADAGIVPDRNQVAQFGATADDRAANRCPVDRRVRADLHVIFENDIADLRDLVMHNFAAGSLMRGEAVPVLANACVGMHGHAIAENAIVIDHGIWIEDAVAADCRRWARRRRRGTARCSADRGGGIDERPGMNAFVRMLSKPIQLNHG